MKNRAYWMIAILFLVAFVTSFNYGGSGDSSGSLDGLNKPDGFYNPFSATGTVFVLEDNPISPDLKITSSEEIHIVISAITNTVSFFIEPLITTKKKEAVITIWGLESFYPDLDKHITLYRHADGYFQQMFKLNQKEKYTYTQDISKRHHIYILPEHGTINIWGRDVAGDEVVSKGVGIWLDATTCQLTTDIAEDIVIQADNITLDGDSHTIAGAGYGYGIYLNSRTGVTITNCNVQYFSSGIYLYSCSSNAITTNAVNNNTYYGIMLGGNSNNNTLTNNTATNNDYYGIAIGPGSNNNTLTNNTANSNTSGGIVLFSNSNNVLINNTASNNSGDGILLASSVNNTLTSNIASNNVNCGIYLSAIYPLPGSSSNTLTNNTANANAYGIYLSVSPNNTIYHNNIYNNTTYNVYSDSAIELSYFNPITLRNEGNWWGKTSAPGFIAGVDSNAFNVVDTYWYLVKDGWLLGYAPGEPEIAPQAPSNLVATPGSSLPHINLTWQDNSNNEQGFIIERSTACHQPFVSIAVVGEDMTTYSDMGVLPGTLYYYRVKAYNPTGQSNPSNRAQAVTFAHITTIEEIISDLEQYYTTGLIKDYNVYLSLNARLIDAQNYINLKDYPSAITQLQGFSDELSLLTEESIDPDAKESLLTQAKLLTDYLKLISGLPVTLGLYLIEQQTCVNEVTIQIPTGGEVTTILKGILNIALAPTDNPDIAGVTIVSLEYSGTPFVVNGIDFGTLDIVQDPDNPSVGTLNLQNGKIDIVVRVLVRSPYLELLGISPVAIEIPLTGTFSPMSLTDGDARLIGQGVIPQDVPVIGGDEFFINCSSHVDIDTTPPVTKPVINPPPNAAGWNNSNVTIILTAEDLLGPPPDTYASGVNQTYYELFDGNGSFVTGTDLTTISQTVRLENEDVFTIRYWSIDNVNNIEPAKTITISIDKTQPVITDSDVITTISTTTITITKVVSDLSGVDSIEVEVKDEKGDTVAKTQISLSSGTITSGTWSGTVTLPEDIPTGEYTRTQTVKDRAGNIIVTSTPFKIDRSPPVVTFKIDPPEPNEFGWYNKPVTVTFYATDTCSGVNRYVPKEVFVFGEGISQTATCTVFDNAGNSTTLTSKPPLNIDKTPPEFTKVPDPITVEQTGYDGVASQDLKKFLKGAEATDALSELQLGYPKAINVPTYFPLGITEVTFEAIDRAGNPATAKSTIEVVDTTPPVITVPPDLIVVATSVTGTPKTNPKILEWLNKAKATDICDPDVVTPTNDAPNFFLIGERIVTFNAIDRSGNPALPKTAKVIVIKIEIIEPDEDPVTDNNFTFDSSKQGECNVKAMGTTHIGSEDPKLEWGIGNILGSKLTSKPGNKKGPLITFTYKGLPKDNIWFGNQALTLAYPPLNATDTQIVQIFFSRDATNNPGKTDPNWFYYWGQTTAGYGSPIYDSTITQTGIAWRNNSWVAILTITDKDSYTPPEGDNGGNQLNGIDNFAWTCRHEGRHVQTSSIWYPNGYNGAIDLDRDWMPDSLEAGLGGVNVGGPFDPTKKDTDGDSRRDDEDYTLHTQQRWTEGSADNEDWANPGHQTDK